MNFILNYFQSLMRSPDVMKQLQFIQREIGVKKLLDSQPQVKVEPTPKGRGSKVIGKVKIDPNARPIRGQYPGTIGHVTMHLKQEEDKKPFLGETGERVIGTVRAVADGGVKKEEPIAPPQYETRSSSQGATQQPAPPAGIKQTSTASQTSTPSKVHNEPDQNEFVPYLSGVQQAIYINSEGIPQYTVAQPINNPAGISQYTGVPPVDTYQSIQTPIASTGVGGLFRTQRPHPSGSGNIPSGIAQSRGRGVQDQFTSRVIGHIKMDPSADDVNTPVSYDVTSASASNTSTSQESVGKTNS